MHSRGGGGDLRAGEAVHGVDDDGRALLLGHLEQRLDLAKLHGAFTRDFATMISASAWIFLALELRSARAMTANSSISVGGVPTSVMRTARTLKP